MTWAWIPNCDFRLPGKSSYFLMISLEVIFPVSVTVYNCGAHLANSLSQLLAVDSGTRTKKGQILLSSYRLARKEIV